ncbi:MAG: DUF6327 family protein [Gillisia sp.]
MKEYRSFEEIDRDLKILKLQNQIDKEELKLSYKHTKESLNPLTILGNMVTSIAQKALVLKAVSKLFGVKRVVTKD